MKNLLVVLLVIGLTGSAMAQGFISDEDRGAKEDARYEAAQRSIENQLIVEEIEDAGFEIDVVEGFDEEWEEDIWVASEADDVDANYIDPSESARFDMTEVPQEDEVAEGWSESNWENPDMVIEEHENALAQAEEDESMGLMRGEEATDSDEGELLASEAALEEDLQDDLGWEDDADDAEASEGDWWEESTENWSALLDDMDELDDTDVEEEDLDLLEELYMTN